MSKIGTGGNGRVSHPASVNGKPARAHEPGKVSRIGQQYIKTGAPEPKLKPFNSGVKHGNEVAKNVGAGGPGTGRTIHGQGGSQSGQSGHGPSAPGPARQTGSDPWRGK